MDLNHQPGLRELLAILYRRKLVLLAVFAITTGAVAAAAYLVPPVFTADSSLIVKFGREFFYRPEVGATDRIRSFKLDEMINSEVEILGSRELARQVVDDLGAATLYPEIFESDVAEEVGYEKSIASFQSDTSVNAVFDSSVIRVSYEHRDPAIAADALNRLVDRFKEKHLEVFGEARSTFLESQLKADQQNLDRAETALDEFRKERGIFDLTTQKEAAVSQVAQLRAELRQTQFRIAELERQKQALSESGDADVEIVPNPTLSRERAALVSTRAELGAQLVETSSRMAELRRQLERFREARDAGTEGRLVPAQPGIERFPALDDARTRVLDLQIKYLELSPKFAKTSREAEAVRKQFDAAQESFEKLGSYVNDVLETNLRDELSESQAKETALKMEVERVEADLQALVESERALQIQTITTALPPFEAQRDNLVAEIAKLESDLEKLATSGRTLRNLERQVALGETRYQTSLERYEEARRAEELDAEQDISVEVLEPAVAPVSTTGLPKSRKVALGAVAGLLAGIAAVFLLELLKQ